MCSSGVAEEVDGCGYLLHEESDELIAGVEKKPTSCLGRFFKSMADFTNEYGGVEVENQALRVKSE